MKAIHPETPSEAVETIREVEEVIDKVSPDFIVLDPLFDNGDDAVRASGRPYLFLSPNTLAENARSAQGLNVFTYPWYVASSGAMVIMPGSDGRIAPTQVGHGLYPNTSSLSTPSSSSSLVCTPTLRRVFVASTQRETRQAIQVDYPCSHLDIQELSCSACPSHQSNIQC